MLKFDGVALRRGSRLVLEQVHLIVHPGQKIGVVGANGAGKSSLFGLVTGELHADAGEVTMPRRATLAHVAQGAPSSGANAIDYVMDGDQELRDIERAMHEAQGAADYARSGELQARFEALDGYGARARAAKLLRGLGFAPADEAKLVAEFSGGWRMRLNLARALNRRSDILLLDEPTNHLDLDAIIWLEQWLESYAGTLLLIAHDREFLDGCVDHVLHIEHRRARLYTGNYSAFETQRAAHLAEQRALYDKQQRAVAHMHRFVERFRYKASKARQAQSRLKALAKLELIEPAHVDSPFRFRMPTPDKAPNPLLRLRAAALGYDNTPVLTSASLRLAPGERIGVLGMNGAGKSTLIKGLAGLLEPSSGEREEAAELRVGYFAQHQLEQLDAGASALAHIEGLDPTASTQSLRDYLGGFGFGGERIAEPVGHFSGGEKARLVLALLLHAKPNLVLLDEPTNHLDLEMRHALTVALQDYAGAIVLVSHDRHLLRMVCDQLFLVADGKLEPFAGDLDDYAVWLRNARANDAHSGAAPSAAASSSRRQRRRHDAEFRRRLQPLRAEVKRLEAELSALAARRKTLEEALADPAAYDDVGKERLTALLKEQGRVDKAITQTEADWLVACERAEAALAETRH